MLGLAQLAPHHGGAVSIRLAAAAACVLILPGALILRLTGWPEELGVAIAGSLTWSLAAIFGCLLLTFAFAGSLTLTLVLLASLTFGTAMPVALRRAAELDRDDLLLTAGVAAAGIAFAVVVWLVAGPVAGDGLFHLARVRKLADFHSLPALSVVDEFKHGGLHPGYAFPLWHGALALISKLSGLDPTQVVRHLSAVLVPLSFVVSYGAGRALFRSPWGGAAALVAQVAQFGLSAGHSGAYRALALPATTAKQLIVPAILALSFTYVRSRSPALLGAIGAGGLALALIHPTYAVFLCIPLAGFLIARALLGGRDTAPLAASLVAILVPTAAVAFWLLPIVQKTATYGSHDLQRGLRKYAGQIDVSSAHSYRLAPEMFSRSGTVAVAALVLIPLSVLAARRRWASYVIGGSLAIFLLTLVPFVFPRFADAVSLSQARRAGGFLPFAFALAGGAAVLARLLSWALLPVALAAGVALQLAFPGDFGYRIHDGGPAVVTWVAVIGGAAVLAAATTFRRSDSIERQGPFALAAVLLFCAPVAAHGLTELDGHPSGGEPALTPGIIRALRDDVPMQDIVFSDDVTAYRIAAYAPVYVNAAPPGHVADTKDNFPYQRSHDSRKFFWTKKGDRLSIPRSYQAQWLVIDQKRFPLRLKRLRRVYYDRRYSLYRL